MYATCRTRTGSSAIRAGPEPHHHVVSPQHHRRGRGSNRCSNGLNAPRCTGLRGPLPALGGMHGSSEPSCSRVVAAGRRSGDCRKGREERASRSRVDPRPLGTRSEPPPARDRPSRRSCIRGDAAATPSLPRSLSVPAPDGTLSDDDGRGWLRTGDLSRVRRDDAGRSAHLPSVAAQGSTEGGNTESRPY
jgi:hypothetical protein